MVGLESKYLENDKDDQENISQNWRISQMTLNITVKNIFHFLPYRLYHDMQCLD